jgi:MoaA/NifB/PqqE/SkfB family radical SAM enzyme
MRIDDVREILRQAQDLGGIEWIFFEGGEAFLFYPILLQAVRLAARKDFRVGIVSNAYWATGEREAIQWLRPFKGLVQDLSISSDRYHRTDELDRTAETACAAAKRLGIPCGILTVAQPEEADAARRVGQLPIGVSAVMYRGRAAKQLVSRARLHAWRDLTTCPYENLRDPERVHIDPLGFVHLCQGLSIGNLFGKSLRDIVEGLDPDSHPIAGPLLKGGPAELVRRYGLPHQEAYADACHLCYESRRRLRKRFPEILAPDQMYGVFV